MEPIKAERATVIFFEGLSVEGYRMPDGEFRVSLTGASLVTGFSREWLGRVLNRGGNSTKALQGMGFKGEILKVATNSGRPPETISLRDFQAVIGYGVQQKKKASIALFNALVNLSLTDFFRDAFGEPPLTIEEKRQLFYETYASTISPEQWREMDRQDIINLALSGDEPPLRWGFWNR